MSAAVGEDVIAFEYVSSGKYILEAARVIKENNWSLDRP